MYKIITIFLLLLFGNIEEIFALQPKGGIDYVVLVSKSVQQDVEWQPVVDELVQRHQAVVLSFENRISEQKVKLSELAPRYVAIVEKSEQLNRDFIIDLNRTSRTIDEDIYPDFLWGIITGYDGAAALDLVRNAEIKQEVGSALLSNVADFEKNPYFEKLAFTNDDQQWGVKSNGQDTLVLSPKWQTPERLTENYLNWYQKNDPEFLMFRPTTLQNSLNFVTNSKNGVGRAFPNKGQLSLCNKPLTLGGTAKVCLVEGLLANTFGTNENVMTALMKQANVTALLGCWDFSTHMRSVWGTLKYWITIPGNVTLSQAHYINQLEIIDKLNKWHPEFLDETYPYCDTISKMVLHFYHSQDPVRKRVTELMGDLDHYVDISGFIRERDVIIYYGDPKWDVTVKDWNQRIPYTIDYVIKGRKCIVTVKTTSEYSWEAVCGDLRKDYDVFREGGTIGPLPLYGFFPQRLKNPRFAKQNTEWEGVIDENIFMITNAYFEPNQTYKIVLNIDK